MHSGNHPYLFYNTKAHRIAGSLCDVQKGIEGVAQALMNSLQKELKQCGVDTLIGLIDSNDGAQRLYHSLPNALVRDEGIWIDVQDIGET